MGLSDSRLFFAAWRPLREKLFRNVKRGVSRKGCKDAKEAAGNYDLRRKTITCWRGRKCRVSTHSSGCSAISLRTWASVIL